MINLSHSLGKIITPLTVILSEVYLNPTGNNGLFNITGIFERQHARNLGLGFTVNRFQPSNHGVMY